MMDLNDKVKIDPRLKKIFADKAAYDKEQDVLKKAFQRKEVSSFIEDHLFDLIREAVFDGKQRLDVTKHCYKMNIDYLKESICKIDGLSINIMDRRGDFVITIGWLE